MSTPPRHFHGHKAFTKCYDLHVNWRQVTYTDKDFNMQMYFFNIWVVWAVMSETLEGVKERLDEVKSIAGREYHYETSRDEAKLDHTAIYLSDVVDLNGRKQRWWKTLEYEFLQGDTWMEWIEPVLRQTDVCQAFEIFREVKAELRIQVGRPFTVDIFALARAAGHRK